MKYSVACICGFETPLVENEEDIDHDLLAAHQEFCEALSGVIPKHNHMVGILWGKTTELIRSVETFRFFKRFVSVIAVCNPNVHELIQFDRPCLELHLAGALQVV